MVKNRKGNAVSKDESLQAIVEAYHMLGDAFEAYARALCEQGKPGLAKDVASAMGLATQAHFAGLDCKKAGRPAYTGVKPCESWKG